MKALLLSDNEANALRDFLMRTGDRSGLLERLDQGGDRLLVQVGMEGGIVQGATASCRADILVVEWDEKVVYECSAAVDAELVTNLHNAWAAYDADDQGNDGPPPDEDPDYTPLLDEFREIYGKRQGASIVAPGQG